ncbi:MAG TPA: hypothetical protein VGH27_24235 [Streptosporangiaceae bacterium]|jgi:hypothetical protein
MPAHDDKQPPDTTVRYYPRAATNPERPLHRGYGGWITPENKATTEQITADQDWLTEHGLYLAQWGPDPVSGKVKVYLTNYTDAARRILLNRYGDAIVVAPKSMQHPIGLGGSPRPGDPL